MPVAISKMKNFGIKMVMGELHSPEITNKLYSPEIMNMLVRDLLTLTK